MKAIEELTFLPSDKGSATMVLNTTGCNWKISAFWRTKPTERGRRFLLGLWNTSHSSPEEILIL
jgi:hypothetical protein